MRVLRFVASSQPADGDAAQDASSADEVERQLLVADLDGEQFLLAVDEALIAACAPATDDATADAADHAPEPQEPRTITHLSPREIQTRIRTGESPQDLAAETGMDVERIMRFGFAVMQERSRVGDEARRARARRDGDGALVPFGETVDRRFSAHGIDPTDVSWDAFRRPDGSWTISATWTNGSGTRSAHWAFSLTAPTVLPADEAAADLLSDRPLRAVVRAVPDAAAIAAQPVDDAVFDQESPGGYTRSTSTTGDDGYGTAPLPLRLADPLPTSAPNPATAAEPDPAIANERRTPASVRLLNPRAAEPAPNEESLTESLLGPADAQEHLDPSDADVPPEPTDPPTAAAPITVPPTTTSPAATPPAGKSGARRRSGREQVPSWDDILLGVRRKQD